MHASAHDGIHPKRPSSSWIYSRKNACRGPAIRSNSISMFVILLHELPDVCSLQNDQPFGRSDMRYCLAMHHYLE